MSILSEQRKIPQDLSRSIQVIGAGMGRTGTVSFTSALSKLLKGPVCHTGSASLARKETWIKKWIAVCNAKEGEDDEYINDTLKDLLAGYVGVTDTPGLFFTRELVKIFPDAKVIVTTRDPIKWWESMRDLVNTVNQMWVLNAIFWPMPTMRYFGRWMDALTSKSKRVYNSDGRAKPELYEHHLDYVKKVVPQERLFFIDVKEGWEPLCNILDCPVPNEPFPHANDKLAVQAALLGLVKAALLRWLGIFAVLGVGIATGLYIQQSL